MGKSLADKNLEYVVEQLSQLRELSDIEDSNQMPIADQIRQIGEWISANETNIAYESIVCIMEKYNFVVPSLCAIKLLEVGLMFRYKTDRDEDKIFDGRNISLTDWSK